MSTVRDPAADRVGAPADTRIASYLLTEYLERLGVEVIFGLCGHTVIAFLDALGKSRIRFVSTRHEQIAAHAADGYARASGKVGVVLTHLGPGLTNAATGVANAALDSIPMVVIAGDIPSYYYGRHPHQEINLHQDADQFQIFRPFCKRVYRVDRVEDLPRIMERAFHLAQTGRPGPVLVDVPMDIFSADLSVDAFDKVPPEIVRQGLDPATATRIVDALAAAERPVLYAGGGVLSARATEDLAALAEALDVPVAHTLMGKGCLRDDHPLLLGQSGFWGTPIANKKCRTADLIVAIGTRLAEANSSSWDPRFTFAIPPTRLHAHRRRSRGDRAQLPDRARRRRGRQAGARGAGRGRQGPPASRPRAAPRRDRPRPPRVRRELGGPVELESVPAAARTHPERAATSRSRGRVHRHRRGVEQERRRTAVPDHRAGHVHHAEWSGDDGLRAGGGAGREAGTAASACDRARRRRRLQRQSHRSSPRRWKSDLPVVWVVMDNSAFGTIAGLEEMHYGSSFGCIFECDGRPYRVDYAAMARSFGAEGIAIERAEELGPGAAAQPWPSNKPTLIQVPMENAPTPTPGHWDINDIYRRGD